LVRATMLSQPLIRSTATCRKCSEYRLFATRSSFPAKCVFILLSHFGGSLHPGNDGERIYAYAPGPSPVAIQLNW